MQRWEKAAVRSQTSLSLLNVTQSAIIAVAVSLTVAGDRRRRRRHDDDRDLVLVNAFMIQIYIRSTSSGSSTRGQAGACRHGAHVRADAEHTEVSTSPRAGTRRRRGRDPLRARDFGYEANGRSCST